MPKIMIVDDAATGSDGMDLAGVTVKINARSPESTALIKPLDLSGNHRKLI